MSYAISGHSMICFDGAKFFIQGNISALSANGIFYIYQKGNNYEHPNFIKKEQQAIYLEDMQYLLPIITNVFHLT